MGASFLVLIVLLHLYWTIVIVLLHLAVFARYNAFIEEHISNTCVNNQKHTILLKYNASDILQLLILCCSGGLQFIDTVIPQELTGDTQHAVGTAHCQ